MNEENRQTVVMTAEEKAEFEAFQQAKAKKVAEEKAKADREMYRQMVDDEIEHSIPGFWASARRSRRASRRYWTTSRPSLK